MQEKLLKKLMSAMDRNEKRIRWNGILRNECRASRRIT